MRVAVREGADGARETVVEVDGGTASLGDLAIETLIAEGQAGLERVRAAAETASAGKDGDGGGSWRPCDDPASRSSSASTTRTTSRSCRRHGR